MLLYHSLTTRSPPVSVLRPHDESTRGEVLEASARGVQTGEYFFLFFSLFTSFHPLVTRYSYVTGTGWGGSFDALHYLVLTDWIYVLIIIRTTGASFRVRTGATGSRFLSSHSRRSRTPQDGRTHYRSCTPTPLFKVSIHSSIHHFHPSIHPTFTDPSIHPSVLPSFFFKKKTLALTLCCGNEPLFLPVFTTTILQYYRAR